MVAINFKAQFADDVESGVKRQTIRRNARCKPGDALQLYTGMRQPGCRKLMDAICTQVIPVEIGPTTMRLNGKPLVAGDAPRGCYEDYDNDFAKKDGFSSYMEMSDWFEAQYGELPFTGFVIRWREA